MIVLDSSVILKWHFLHEAHREKALEWRDAHLAGRETIAAPDLLPYEIANVLSTKTNVSEPDALAAVIQILSSELQIHHPEPDDYLGMIRLSRSHRLSVYDVAYVHLAQKLGCGFVTADKKLHQKTKSLPFVRLLQEPERRS